MAVLHSGQGGRNPARPCDSWLHFVGYGDGQKTQEVGRDANTEQVDWTTATGTMGMLPRQVG